MTIALIPCAACDWRLAGRLLGRVELPPADRAAPLLQKWTASLRSIGLSRIFHASDELSAHAARLLAAEVGCPHKVDDELVEVDLGLWVGLTADELEMRYPSAAHELLEAPLNVAPPAGEALCPARERLRSAIQRRTRRLRSAAVGFVLRPLALSLARSFLAGLEAAEIWPCVLAEDELVLTPAARASAPARTRS